jgi:hypothetical protein
MYYSFLGMIKPTTFAHSNNTYVPVYMYMYQVKNSPKSCACRTSVSCCEGVSPLSFVANNYHGWIPGIFWGRILQIGCIFERGKNDSKQFVSVASITL